MRAAALLGGAAALVLVTSTAQAAVRPAVGLAVSPYHYVLAAGERSATLAFTATSRGTTRERVTATLELLSQTRAGCRLGQVPASAYGSWRPPSVELRPGHHRHLVLHLQAPASATGVVHLAAVLTASPADGASIPTGARLTAAIGSQVVLRLGPGKGTTLHCLSAPRPRSPVRPSSVPAWPFVAGALVVAVPALLISRRRSRRRV